jgi:hypothetical protein
MLASSDRIETQIGGVSLDHVPGVLAHHRSLLRELDLAPEIREQQMGHKVDVNENVYTKNWRAAGTQLEAALG